jgi:hypothetical protein
MGRARPLPHRLVLTLTVLFVAASAAFALAQRGRSLASVAWAPEQSPDGKPALCRLAYDEGIRFGMGWQTDFPLGERNLSIRLSELTRTDVSRTLDGSRKHYVVRLSDDALFSCPFLMAGDVGSIDLSATDAARLREYLLKGGFLWTDDMWGEEQWDVWRRELAKVFSPDEYPIEELTTADPIFQAQFVLRELPQISNLGFWRRNGHTSEHGAATAVPHFHAVRDRHGRIMIAMTRNTDIADAFEQEGADPEFFALFGAPGYSLGINIILYAMTH